MEAQANTTREQSNKKNIYEVGWRPSQSKNGVGKKKKKLKGVSRLRSSAEVARVNYTLMIMLFPWFKVYK